MNSFFGGKVALVTGGSSGIGLAIARQLAQNGARAWLLARHPGRLEQARQAVEAVGGQRSCELLCADVCDGPAVGQAIEQVLASDGAVDFVFNCAGVAHPGYFQELDPSIFRLMMEVNYFGTVNVTKAVVPHMIERRRGHIVNFSSVAGFLGVFGYTAYGASKFAVRGFSDALRAELKPLGVRVSIVFPPDTDTPQLAYENQFKPPETKALAASARIMQPEKVAEATLKGVARGRYIILPGFEAKALFYLTGLLGPALYPVMDWLVARARKQATQSRGV
jgi:3-dehydrosphinganine reductase